MDLAKDIIIAYRTEVRDSAQLQKSADRLTQSTQDFRLVLGDPGYRGNLRDVMEHLRFNERYCYLMMLWNFATT